MKQKNLLVSIILLVLIVLGTVYTCKLKPTPQNDKPIIRIGYMDWAGFYPILLAIKKGRFDNKDYSIALVKAKDNMELNSLVSTGKVDLCFGAFADHIYMKGNDIQIKFIYATDFSKSDVIVAEAGIKSVKDLENKKISITDLNSFSEFFVLTTLSALNVDLQKVTIKVIDFENVLTNIDNKVIQAGHTWDPETPKAIKKGFNVIASSADIKGIVIDGLIATEEILNKHTPAIADILLEINLELKTIHSLSEDEIEFLATHFKTNKESVHTVIQNGIEFLDLSENKILFESKKDYSFSYWLSKVSDFYSSRGQLNKTINTHDLLEPSPLLLAISKGGK